MPETLLPSTWTAAWIEPVDAPDTGDVHRPGYHLADEFEVSTAPVQATLHLTAHGLVEAFLNGERVGNDELVPGFTAYRSRLQVFSYDVTSQVRRGANALGLLLTDGWWRGQTTVARKTNRYGSTVAAFAELHLHYPDGSVQVVTTGPAWRWTTGHVLAADLMSGEHHDMTRQIPDWAVAGTDRSAWQPVRVADHGTGTLTAPIGPRVRRLERLPAVSVREVAPGRHIVDFGRNSNGWVRVTDLGPRGTLLTLVHSEALSPDGDDVQNACHETAMMTDWGVPFQTDVVVSAGPGSVFEPRHSTKGFRYLRVDGHPGPLDPGAFTSVVVRNDLASVGGFQCSDDDLNRLHEAAEWSLLTNCCDIPTDCPTRERAGWTGDWQVFVSTAAYLRDVTGFSVKWLHDLAADQLSNGAVCNFIPEPADFSDPTTAWWRDLQGSAGWGDAVVHVPWQLYRSTGDAGILEAFFEPMRRWVDFAAASAASGRHANRVAARPVAASHEPYVWDTGFHFGEWNEPGAEEGQIDRIRVMDHGPTATAFLFRSSDELAQIAAVLGKQDEAILYEELAAKVKEAWQQEFVTPDGHLTVPTQANLVRALAFDLAPVALREQLMDDLVATVLAADTHLATGFLATPFLLPTLADNGRPDLAFALLTRRTFPSWLGMLDAGATTIWEGWDSLKPDGSVTSSLNHFSMGAVVSFLHRYVAGLNIVEPGYRRFRVQPVPGAGVTQASTQHESPFGTIRVAWALADDVGTLNLTVPPGTQADVQLPDGTEQLIPSGHHVLEWKQRAGD